MTAITKSVTINNYILSDDTHLESKMYYFSFKINTSDEIKIPVDLRSYTKITYFDLIKILSYRLNRYGINVSKGTNSIVFSIPNINSDSLLQIIEVEPTSIGPTNIYTSKLSDYMNDKNNWLWTHIKDYVKP